MRVGATPITKATVDHWTSVMQYEHGEGERLARQRALGFLISTQWLTGQAGEQGRPVTNREVELRLAQERRELSLGGEAELRSFLAMSRRTVTDMMLEIKAQLASAAINSEIVGREGKVTQARVARYYVQHRQSFATPERREVQLTYSRSRADSVLARRDIESGRSFAGVAKREIAQVLGGEQAAPRQGELARAAESAAKGVLTGPVKVGRDYAVFTVTQVVPAGRQPLARVKGEIEQQLAGQAHRAALARFRAAWRAKWTARTSCRPGYVVPECSQYPAGSATAPAEPYPIS